MLAHLASVQGPARTYCTRYPDLEPHASSETVDAIAGQAQLHRAGG